MKKVVHVAVGVVFNHDKEVLIALRDKSQHQGGLWEFPGGKVEAGEDVKKALIRELKEEVGIVPQVLTPLIKIPFDYPDKSVLLDVWTVESFDSEASGLEGQQIRWVNLEALSRYDFPVANKPIIKALKLPSAMAITGSFETLAECEEKINIALTRGAGLVQLRPNGRETCIDDDFICKVAESCRAAKASLVVNSGVPGVSYSEAVGLHLRSDALKALLGRPVPEGVLLGASCHDWHELQHAETIGVDYAVLSPVKEALSHSAGDPMGWERFSETVLHAKIPVFALGGLGLSDLQAAKTHGAQGVAGISYFWC